MNVIDFDARNETLELMDEPGHSPEELAETLRELAFINKTLGGHASSLEGLALLIPPGRREFSVLDVGSGGGDAARCIVEWARRRGMVASVHGVDLSEEAVACARRASVGLTGLEFTACDLFDLPSTRRYDVVHAALLLHHLPDEMAVKALAKMFELSRWGIVINDLHRHPVAYYSIKALTAALSGNRLIRHDAPLSVLRAFRRGELNALVHRAGLSAAVVCWRWAFRWLLVARR